MSAGDHYIRQGGTTNTGIISISQTLNNVVQTPAVILHNDGDIYQDSDRSKSAGVFNRLERIEEMMGILRRNHKLENIYEPLAEAGDKYDAVLEQAIAEIMKITSTHMKKFAEDYDELAMQAEVYRKLTKDTLNDNRT
jgi:hypothetical protein